jgi:hypothetical protein
MFTIGVVASVKICRGGGGASLGRVGPAPDGSDATVERRDGGRGSRVAPDDAGDSVTAAHGPAPQEGSTT